MVDLWTRSSSHSDLLTPLLSRLQAPFRGMGITLSSAALKKAQTDIFSTFSAIKYAYKRCLIERDVPFDKVKPRHCLHWGRVPSYMRAGLHGGRKVIKANSILNSQLCPQQWFSGPQAYILAF